MKLKHYQSLNIGIFGLGISGISTYKFLKKSCKKVICFDDAEHNRQNFKDKFDQLDLVEIAHDDWKNLDKIVISPGVPHEHPVFKIAAENDTQISSDIEIFMQINAEAEFILITGTNGKSTTSSLIYHILNCNELNYELGGNIGVPVFDLNMGAKGYVLELSSFQIDLLGKINAKISILLNISPDHLDRHKTFEEYVRVKKKILSHNNYKIIGLDNPTTCEIYKKNVHDKDKNIGFSTHTSGQNIVTYDAKSALIKGNIKDDFFEAQLNQPKSLHGMHNAENILAAYAACRLLQVEHKDILSSISSFKALPYRNQFEKKINNINFYNDSKATNTAAAILTASSFDNLYWLIGGAFKENDFNIPEDQIDRIKFICFYGQDGGKVKDMIKENLKDNMPEYGIFNDLAESVNEAFSRANQAMEKSKTKEEYTILLAPACTSYDQYNNYLERGKDFTNIVAKLK